MDQRLFHWARERVANHEILMSQIRPIIETKTKDEWNELLSDADIPC